MKKLLITGFVLLSFALMGASIRTVYGQLFASSASTATPTQFSTTNLFVTSVTLIGNSASRTPNSGTVYIGPTSVNDAQQYPVTPGGTVTILAYPGTEFNLKDWYLDVTVNNDGLYIIYQ